MRSILNYMRKKSKHNSFLGMKIWKSNSVLSICMIILFHISAPIFGQVESFNLSLMNDTDLQQMLSKISSSEKIDDYDGSPYLFKNEKKGSIVIGEMKSVSVNATFNLNFLNMKFFIYEEGDVYLLDSSEVTSFDVGDFTYIRNDDNQFVKIIFKDENITLFEKYYLEIKDQPYVVGYEKPSNNLINIKKSVLININGNSIPFKPKLKFLQSLFDSNISDLKKFIKQNSLKLRNHQDLKLIFGQFKIN